MANVDLSVYDILASGVDVTYSTGRTIPDRLVEHTISVKDWGAKGDGTTDDRAAIQAAVDYAYMNVPTATDSPYRHGAIVYLPPGTYRIGGTTPLRLSPPNPPRGGISGIKFVGASRDSVVLMGNIDTGAGPRSLPNSFLVTSYIDPSIPVHRVSGMTIWNQGTGANSGALCMQGGGNSDCIEDCRFIGNIGLYYAEEAYVSRVSNCLAQNSAYHPSLTITTPPTANNFVPFSAGETAVTPRSIGFYVGQCVIRCCTAEHYDIGFAYAGDHGSGNTIFSVSNKASRCKIGHALGFGAYSDPGGNISSAATLISDGSDRCQVGFYSHNSNSATVIAHVAGGSLGVADPATISAMSWTAGTVTVTTPAHNISGDSTLLITASPGAWTPDGTGNSQMVSCHVIDSTHFSFTGVASNPGSFTSGTWNYALSSGMSIQLGEKSSYVANYVPATVAYKSFDLNNLGWDSSGQRNSTFMATHAPYGWSTPGGAATVSASQFVNCSGTNLPLVYLTLTQAGGAGVDGTIANIIDGQSASFGDVVTGGGSNHYKIRSDGTNWRRVG